MKKGNHESAPLAGVLEQMERLIKNEFGTFEKFAYGSESLAKSTVTRLFADRKDCKVSTLKAIADELGVELVLRVKKRD